MPQLMSKGRINKYGSWPFTLQGKRALRCLPNSYDLCYSIRQSKATQSANLTKNLVEDWEKLKVLDLISFCLQWRAHVRRPAQNQFAPSNNNFPLVKALAIAVALRMLSPLRQYLRLIAVQILKLLALTSYHLVASHLEVEAEHPSLSQAKSANDSFPIIKTLPASIFKFESS
jgi:hypothetical protein